MDTIVVWVEPTPRITLTPGLDTICTSLRPSVLLTTITRSLNPVRFRYEAVYDPANLEVHYQGDTIGLIPGYTIIDSVVNLTATPQLVRFSVYPYLQGSSGIEKCGGIYDTADIWVAPTLIIHIDSVSTYIGGRNIRCFGEDNGFIRLMPAGGIEAFSQYDVFDLTYAWSTTESTKDIEDLTAGAYSVTVSDKLLCRDVMDTTLTQPDLMVSQFVIVDTLSCKGNDGKIAVAVSGGTPAYKYYWYPWEAYGLPPGYYTDTLKAIVPGPYSVVPYDTNGCVDSIYMELITPKMTSVNAIPDVYGAYNIRCSGDSSGVIRTYTTYADSITYNWSGPAGYDTIYKSVSTTIISNLIAGQYNLRYTDKVGCYADKRVIIRQPLPLTINQSILSSYHSRYNVSCFDSVNGSITLNQVTGGHGGYLFDWEIIAGDGLIDPNLRNQVNIKAGTYAVEVSDVQGCFARDTFEMVQPAKIIIDHTIPLAPFGTTNLNCFGDANGSISLQVSGGDTLDGPYQYQWQSGPAAPQWNNLTAGEYAVTVTDGINCSVSDTIALTEPPELKIDSTRISDYHGYEIACSGDANGYINIYASGGSGGYSYSWKRDGIQLPLNSSQLVDLIAGAYSLSITDANNCRVDRNIVMDPPEPLGLTIDTTSVDCTGDSKGTARANASGGIVPYQFSWSDGQASDYATGLDTGTYNVTVTDHNGCYITGIIDIDQDPTVEFDMIVTKEISCYLGSDGIITVDVTSGIPPYAFKWNVDSVTSSLTGVGEGSYNVMVTDSKGCKFSRTLQVNGPERISPLATVFDALCYGSADGEVSLDASGGSGSYHYWLDGEAVSGTTVSGLIAGSYSLHTIDFRECAVDTTITVGQPEKIMVSIDETNTLLPFCPDWRNGTLVVTATGGTPAYEYSWQDYPEISDSVLPDVKEGFYAVRVTDQQNCFADTTFNLVSQQNSCLDIPTAFTPNNDGANDFWDISYMNEQGEAPFYTVYPNGSIKIYDRWGTLVFQCENGCHDMWRGQDLKGRELPSDSYHFIIELNIGDGRPDIIEKGAVTIIK